MDLPDKKKSTTQQLKVRLLFGLFEADATGLGAMAFVVLILLLFGGGRLLQLW